MRNFRRDISGSMMVEALLSMPLLILFTVAIVQIGLTFWVVTSMNFVTRTISREISVGELDDETNGVLTACGSISGVSANGNPSAEAVACELVESIPGDYFVRASDGTANGTAPSGTSIVVQLNVLTESIAVVDVLGLASGSQSLSATSTHIRE